MREFFKNIVRFAVVLIILSRAILTEAQVNFTYHSNYTYLKGKDATGISPIWMKPGFDNSGWSSGNAPFRYGDGTDGTELSDMLNGYSTVYLRSSFICSNKDKITGMTIRVDYDDGFILWINGIEALRVNAPVSSAYNSFAPANHESGTGENYEIGVGSLNLNDGPNLIAVQAFNVSLSSSDFYFDLAFSADPYLPEITDTAKVDFSVSSGFYINPFYVTLNSPDPYTKLIYTLDGSDPQSSTNSYISTSPATVQIDPSNTEGRGTTPGVIIRASVYKDGYKPSIPSSRTYLFLEKVKTQSWPGGGWPSNNINGQLIDLGMDSKIVDDSDYDDLIDDALLDIPSISIATDLKNLFDPAQGIYVNASGHGLNWEKECSVELINPDGSEGFNVNAGLRIRGGWSRHDDYPKHAFRLFFREEYGNDKLYFPLFGNEGADHYDKIDLRCEENYAWSNGSRYNSAVREVFSRDMQKDMGQPYTRSRYYHLYINGMYWGLYQTQERSEARYASSYFGGSEDDYDVVKVSLDNFSYTIEATDGDLDSWTRLWNMCATGFNTDASYFKVEGKDYRGKPVKGSEVLVDIDNLIDYMLVIFYTGNFDAPSSSFFSNKGCNNFYAIDDRTDKSKGFTFYAHDSEHSLFDEAHSPGVGITEDRVNLAARTDNMKMEVSTFLKFHPQWLHYKLSANKEYRIRFADRAYRQFSEGGVFNPDSCLKRLDTRVNQVDMAIIAESARWGDAKTGGTYAYSKNSNWIPEINKIRNVFFPERNSYVINQLKIAGLYPALKAPVIGASGTIFHETNVELIESKDVQISNPGSSGIIYYTFDGADPRSTGDKVYSSAIGSTGSIDLTISESTIVKARILANDQWSAMTQVNFIKTPEDYSDLKVTELSYHPEDYITVADTVDGKDLEFIEFKNIGNHSINLSGLRLDSAVQYVFPDNVLLPPGSFYVIASKPAAFYNHYGLVASGNFQGNLSNAGEEVLLTDRERNTVAVFTYEDIPPWPVEADGNGYTLSSAINDPEGNPSDYMYWAASSIPYGTPFADNINTEINPPDQLSDETLSVYPNPTDGLININYITIDHRDQIQISLIDLYGRKVYDATIDNPGIIDLADKGLSSGIYILKIENTKFKSGVRIILLR